MIAIQTKYIPATNTRGSRIKAWVEDIYIIGRSGFYHSVTIPYPHELSHELVHYEAVKALVKKHALDWNITDMRYGGTEHGYVFCFSDSVVKEQ